MSVSIYIYVLCHCNRCLLFSIKNILNEYNYLKFAVMTFKLQINLSRIPGIENEFFFTFGIVNKSH